jgi:hypothetical protein
MCTSIKCRGCGKLTPSCSLSGGLCQTCRGLGKK